MSTSYSIPSSAAPRPTRVAVGYAMTLGCALALGCGARTSTEAATTPEVAQPTPVQSMQRSPASTQTSTSNHAEHIDPLTNVLLRLMTEAPSQEDTADVERVLAQVTDPERATALAAELSTYLPGWARAQRYEQPAVTTEGRVAFALSLAVFTLAELGPLVPGGVRADATPLPWSLLHGFEYEEGMELPPQIRELRGHRAVVWGFVLALEDNTFLLAERLWGPEEGFGEPPDLHQAIVIQAPQQLADTLRLHDGKAVALEGRFEASEEVEEDYVVSLYRMRADAVRPITADGPLGR